ncbi:T9SS type A sorting domain-containing protein, partial [bacterium]|nr:T9SS type A sorting domain-containing protein [bacterium]
NLTINNATSSATNVTACDTYTWAQNSITYTATGLYNDTIQNAAGCDSVITLNLTINNATSSATNVTACDTYTWAQNSMTYTATGLYNDTIQNAAGCDSVITLNLTIDSVDYTITQNNAVLTANQAGATYQWIDCTNGDTAITGATSQSYTAIINGNYAVVVTLNSCSDTSACSTVVGVGINESYLASSLRIYPNPTTQQIVIENTSTDRINKIIVRNTIGQIVSTVNEIIGQKQTIDLIGERGIYFVEVINQNGKSQLFKVIKK